MQKYTRILEAQLGKHFDEFKQAIVLLGPRQVGKTTLLKRLFPNATYLLLDNEDIKSNLETYNSATYRSLFGSIDEIIIDELHLLSDPGRAVKLIYDELSPIKIIVTGSSSLHIKNKTSESMTGRKIEYKIFPLTFSEMLFQQGLISNLDSTIISNIINKNTASPKLYPQEELLENTLLYGLYPDAINLSQKRLYLSELAESVIFRDIIALELLEERGKALKLLKALAFQIGNLINYDELSNMVGLDRRTVRRYIEIFEQSFIIFRLYPFSRNPRDEIGKSAKIYFYDIGLRNALIENFSPISIRSDAGAIFENFIISEVKKEIAYFRMDYKLSFWRLKNGSEVDLILTGLNSVIGCEIKLKDGRITNAFKNRYPDSDTYVLNSKNFF